MVSGVCVLDLPQAVCPCLSSLMAMFEGLQPSIPSYCAGTRPLLPQVCVHTGIAGAGMQLELGLGVI